jgi:hypothetical protein
MKKFIRSKLALTREVVRLLKPSELEAIATANSGPSGSVESMQITQCCPALVTGPGLEPSQCSRADSGCGPATS